MIVARSIAHPSAPSPLRTTRSHPSTVVKMAGMTVTFCFEFRARGEVLVNKSNRAITCRGESRCCNDLIAPLRLFIPREERGRSCAAPLYYSASLCSFACLYVSLSLAFFIFFTFSFEQFWVLYLLPRILILCRYQCFCLFFMPLFLLVSLPYLSFPSWSGFKDFF